MNIAIGWAIALIFANYAIYALTGYPLFWCLLTQATAPLAFYRVIVNLGLAGGIIAGGIWYGANSAIKVAALMFGFNLLPPVLEALMGFGCHCG